MKPLFGSHPAKYAFLLGGGAFLILYYGYNLWVPSEAVAINAMDSTFVQGSYWVLFGLGVILWTSGGIAFCRDRGINGFLALCIHLLLPVLGLVLVAIFRRRLTPHEAWMRD